MQAGAERHERDAQSAGEDNPGADAGKHHPIQRRTAENRKARRAP